jgi:hypothetical protein
MMIISVKERGQFVATMRYVHVALMETLAAWVPTTPEMEVKLLFGEHIWDVAQHADALGKRTFELRLPLQHSLRPADAYAELLADIAALAPTPERIAAIYDVLLPGLANRYRRYLSETDVLLDAPTARIIESWLFAWSRMQETRHKLCTELPNIQVDDAAWVPQLQARETAVHDLVDAQVRALPVEA